MNERRTNSRQGMYKAELMKRILEVRYTDLDEERNLCKRLLEVAEPEQDTYGCAFANVYMTDSLLALGEYSSCNFYLVRAIFLCREHGYDDLLLMLCNFAGLYYTKLSDEQSALQYYLEGLKLARRVQDWDTESKLLNNIGIGFGGREDCRTAKEYFTHAYEAAERSSGTSANMISYLCNLAEMCESSGDLPGAQQALQRCDALNPKGQYNQIRLSCAWCNYYAVAGETEKSMRKEEHLHELGFLEFENKFFVYDMCIGICETMLNMKDNERAMRYMKILDSVKEEVALLMRFQIQNLKIRFLEQYGNEQQLDLAYREYYETQQQMDAMDDQARTQSMLSKIQLTRVQMEREAMRRENSELESVGQLDELTGLYNRRYFNKLISKTVQGQNLYTMGFIMLDVDYFKQYNDHYGHFMGDTALKAVAEVLSQFAVDGIYASRYGGDEYVCFCVNMPDEAVNTYVEQVDGEMRRRQIHHEKSGCSEWLTLSIGYCNEPVGQTITADELLHLADQALYQVKQSGRAGYARKYLNQVE